MIAARHRGLLGAAFLLAVLVGAARGQAVPSVPPDKKPPEDKGKKETPIPYPPNSVIVVAGSVKEALAGMPRAVFLWPEEYARLVARLEALEAGLARLPTLAPSKCVLRGKVEGALAAIEARFEFSTLIPGTVVHLGCAQGAVTGATLDDRAVQLLTGKRRGAEEGTAEGYSAIIDRAGDHQLVLQLLVPLGGGKAGASSAVVLDLPRAASTELDLVLPRGSKDVRIGGKTPGEALVELDGARVRGPLGVADRLDLAWKGASPSARGTPTLLADGVVQVRLDPRALTVEARLVLTAQGGAASVWQLVLPARAELKVDAADEPRVAKVEASEGKQGALRTIRLREPSAEPLTVTVSLPAVVARPGLRVPVGPFLVLGAARQSGTVLVSNGNPDLHLSYQPHASLARRGLTDEERKRDPSLVTAFRYGELGGPVAPPKKGKGVLTPALALPWLDVEAETVRGQLRTHVQHTVTALADAPVGTRWRVVTAINCTPRWGDVDRLLVELPAGYDYVEDMSELPDRVRQVTFDRAARTVEFRLHRGGREPALEAFRVSLETVHAPPAGAGVRLALPRPVGTVEQGGEVVVRLPKNMEVVPPRPGEGAVEVVEQVRPSPQEAQWRWTRRGPDFLDFGWRPWQPEVGATAEVDLDLIEDGARVRRHLVRFSASPASLVLRVPSGAANSLKVVQGGRLLPSEKDEAGGFVRRRVALTNGPLVLEYSSPRSPGAEAKGIFQVPLVYPEGMTRGETRARVWTDAGILPALGPGWTDQGIEVVPDQTRLPVLVGRSDRIDRPLVLRLADEAGPGVLVDRVLARARVEDGGTQVYRVSYLLARLGRRDLEMELPAIATALDLRITLDGRRVDWEPVDEAGRRDDAGRVARFRLSPPVVRERAVLEVSYRLPPGRTAGGPLRTALVPPALRGQPGAAPLRWLVSLPGNWVPVAPESGPGIDRAWGLRGWLFAPRLAVSEADLERWFLGSEGTSEGWPVAVTVWRDSGGPLVVTHVPRTAWLLGCSLAVLVLGLGLAWLAWPADGSTRSPLMLWTALALLALLVVVPALLWPGLLGQVASAAQPGAAVLLLVAVFQGLAYRRARRGVIFLPTFTRGRPGSTMTRPEAPPLPVPHGEPSTVDVPARTGSSSLERGGPG